MNHEGEGLPLSRSRCAVSGYPFCRAPPRNAPETGAGLLSHSVPQACGLLLRVRRFM